MKIRIGGDRLAALMFLMVVLAYGWACNQLTASLQGDLIGPAFFPRVLTVLGVVLAILLVIRPSETSKEKSVDRGSDITALVPAAMLLGYALAFDFLGFLLATPLFLMAAFRYLGQKGWGSIVGYSLAVTAVLFVLFQYFLDLRLPLGLISKLI